MENIKKERQLIRNHFSKICRELDMIFQDKAANKQDLLAISRQLEDKGDRLLRADENIRECFLSTEIDDAAFEEEYDTSEFYREELIKYKSRCEFFLKKETEDDKYSSHSWRSDTNRRKYRLPKIELRKFDGDVKNWIGFWGQFKKIHDDEEIDLTDKFQYLLQSTEQGSIARELIESFPPSGTNYQIAIDQLKARFARDELLVEVYVRELLSLVMKQAMKNTGMTLCQLYDKLETQLRALETLGVTKEKYAAMLFPLVESALPDDLLKVWERYRNANKKKSSLDHARDNTDNLSLLLDFLRSEVESEERINLAQSSFNTDHKCKYMSTAVKHKKPTGENGPYTAAALYSANLKGVANDGKKIPFCLFCEKMHTSQDCVKAQKLSLDERKTLVMNKKGCFTCLKQNHTSKNCKAFVKCIVCSRKHYPIMCHDLIAKQDKIDKKEEQPVENVLASNYKTTVLLQTIMVRISNNNREKIVRALLDSGSQRSYILTSCIKDMKLNKIDEEIIVQGVFGGQQSSPQAHGIYDITIKSLHSSYKCNLKVTDQNKICNQIPRLHDCSCIDYLKSRNIIITDVSVNDAPLEIELLLGGDIFGKLLTGNTENINGDLFAIETYLGWTVIGKVESEKNDLNIFSGFADFSISDLWSLEMLGIKESAEVQSKEILEENSLKQFLETVEFNEDNRYEVQLPWKEGHPTLLSNEELARSRLFSNSKKLLNIGKFNDYEKVFTEWEMLGIIERVIDNSDKNNRVHYLPHHAVIKENSSTTKVRPVYDASAKDKMGNSLNDCLEKGPNILELIPNILMKFRTGSIGVISDIEKAFLQISVKPRDRDYLRFFWWEDYESGKMKVYRHCRVVFGVKSSPFLLTATMNHHLDKVPEQFMKTATKLKNSFYVDNCVTSVNTEEELKTFIEESKQLMSNAKFNLRGWTHNKLSTDTSCNENVVGVLGLLWNVEEDTLYCDIDSLVQLESIPRTKRGLLSTAQKIFDPIGFVCPVTLIPKLLLQKTWQLKLGWDQELPVEIIKPFEAWLKQIHMISLCRVPRTLGENFDLEFPENSSIHVFCDASKLAIASCIYLRTTCENFTSVRLLQAKSRLAPKDSTIPRLELIAALLGVRLCRSMKEVEGFRNMKTYYWSDSMVALTWIKTKGNWNTFVGNRVKEIRSFSQIQEWHFVSGKLNPGDIPSRGCNIKNLLENCWINGPSWLKDDSKDWPTHETTFSMEEVNKEERKTIVTLISKVNISTDGFNYFSKYSKIVRMMGWILRFLNNSRKISLRKIGTLGYDEIMEAEIQILKLVQLESFGDEAKSIQNLHVFRDANGLWRIKTKLILGELSEDFKCPIVLPNKHKIVRKIIEENHRLNFHAGVQALLCILRDKFWILRGRQTIKRIVSKCVICKRYNAKFVQTPLSPLPKDRITCKAAFEIVGIDLAGPLYLKNKSKSWIVVYTCAVYRAVHFELVESLSTDSFLSALRRFIARRGRISTIYSDNGTNFVGAHNQMNKVDWDKVLEYSNIKKIKWNFNPPTSAWWGGWWERIVRIIKELLRKNLGKSSVTYEELLTLLCDCETVINARPLTYVSEDHEDLSPLTPAMFINDIPNHEMPDLDEIDRNSLIKRRRYIQKLRDCFRNRFKKEYLAELVNTGQSKVRNLDVGDIVLVGAENVKRTSWPLRKILETYPGKDNIHRVAKVKTMNGEILRPFQRLYPLEVKSAQKLIPENGNLQDSDEKDEEDGSKCEKKTRILTRSGRLVKSPKRFGHNV